MPDHTKEYSFNVIELQYAQMKVVLRNLNAARR